MTGNARALLQPRLEGPVSPPTEKEAEAQKAAREQHEGRGFGNRRQEPSDFAAWHDSCVDIEVFSAGE